MYYIINYVFYWRSIKLLFIHIPNIIAVLVFYQHQLKNNFASIFPFFTHHDDRFFVTAPRMTATEATTTTETNEMHLRVTSNFRAIVILNNLWGRTMAIMIYSASAYTWCVARVCVYGINHIYLYSIHI